MSKKSNDNIEEFFKKGVRKSDITFRESDWQKMERMLDEKAMVGSASTSRPWKRVIGIVLIVALLSSLYFLIPGETSVLPVDQNQLATNNKEENATPISTDKEEMVLDKNPTGATQNAETSIKDSDNQQLANPTKSDLEIKPSLDQQSAESEIATTRKAKQNAAIDLAARPTRSSQRSPIIAAASKIDIDKQAQSKNDQQVNASSSLVEEKKNETDNISASGVEAQSPTTAIASRGDQSPQHLKEQEEKQVPDKKSKQIDLTETSTPSNANQSSLRVGVNDGSPSHHVSGLQKDSTEIVKAENNVVVQPTSQKENDEEKKDKTVTPSRWSIALVVAPEFSSTSMEKQTVPGSAYGLTIGYRIIDRLTISTGILKTYKKYVGYGEDYQPPAGYWQFKTNGIVPDEVSGQCSVIEVPLMVQYDLLQREKSRLFASAGASSYRMLNEAYTYTFNEPNDGAADGWSSDQPSSYYFSVGHLSLGYDRRLYRGLYVGVEPYVKIPFAGIGWSNVNLLTMGAYVNVRYRFSRRN